jgi:hypothetical protein
VTVEIEKFDLGFTVMSFVKFPLPTVAVTVPLTAIMPDQVEPPVGPETVTPGAENDHWVTVPLDTAHDTEAPRVRLVGVQDNWGAGSTSTEYPPLVGDSPGDPRNPDPP